MSGFSLISIDFVCIHGTLRALLPSSQCLEESELDFSGKHMFLVSKLVENCSITEASYGKAGLSLALWTFGKLMCSRESIARGSLHKSIGLDIFSS